MLYSTTPAAEKRRILRERLAAALRLNVEAVSVKATTTEGLGFVGREEGIEVRCVVTVRGDRAG